MNAAPGSFVPLCVPHIPTTGVSTTQKYNGPGPYYKLGVEANFTRDYQSNFKGENRFALEY